MDVPCLKDTRQNPSKFPMTPCSLGVKLSRGLVLTGCWAHPNCNLVLNGASSPRRLLRQKLQDGKRISFLGSVKRPLYNIHQNGWCITQSTQPERRMSHLESRSYNRSHLSPRAYCFSKIVDKKPFLICFKSSLNFLSSPCISFTPTQVYSVVRICLWATSLWDHKCLPIAISL
jgi:hypothetical protein